MVLGLALGTHLRYVELKRELFERVNYELRNSKNYCDLVDRTNPSCWQYPVGSKLVG